MSSPVRDYSLIRNRIETDAYNPVLVEDLINGLNDWRSVQEIVRLTFKALSDVVKSQGASLKELELQLPSKASKSEITQCLTLKASQTEITRSISEMKSLIENKMNVDDVYSIVEEKVSRNDLQYLLSTKASYEELRSSLAEKADLREVQSEIRAMRAILEEMSEENYRKFQQCASKRDLQQLQTLIEAKVSKEELNELLEEKANKQSVANALHRKANKSDLDPVIANKVEISEHHKLFESFQETVTRLDLKVDRDEVMRLLSQESLRKADRSEIESAVVLVQNSQKESENKLYSYIAKIESYASGLKSKVEEVQDSVFGTLNKKGDIRDIERIMQSVTKKADFDQLREISTGLQSELKEQVQNLRYESLKLQEAFSDKYVKFESSLRSIQNEVTKAHENIRAVSENSRVNLEEGVKSVQHYTGSRFEEVKQLKQEIDRIYRDLSEIKNISLDRSELRKTLDMKMDSRELKEFVDKNSRDLMRQLQLSNDELKDLILRKEKELSLLIDKKPGIHEINSIVLENSVQRKSYIEESYKDERHMKLSAYKSDSALESIQRDLSRMKIEFDDRISSFISDQNALNEMICSENCVARWLWRSGELRGSLIPWEFESVNNCPENYIWEASGTTIIAVASGLYEIFYAIFSRKKPNIQLLVNGEPVFLDFSSTGKTWGRHSDGNIISASVSDFITLPAQARISINYNGESGAEGVLGLRKL